MIQCIQHYEFNPELFCTIAKSIWIYGPPPGPELPYCLINMYLMNSTEMQSSQSSVPSNQSQHFFLSGTPGDVDTHTISSLDDESTTPTLELCKMWLLSVLKSFYFSEILKRSNTDLYKHEMLHQHFDNHKTFSR